MNTPDNVILDRLGRIFLVITNRCGASCKLCSYWQSEPVKYLDLSFIRQKIVPLISKYRVEVTFVTGGEPTLHPHLPEILKEISTTGTSITLITNGSALNKVFDSIKKYVDAYMLSLDAGNPRLHYKIRGLDNFSELISWPGKIKAQNPRTQVAFSCLLQKENAADIVNLYRLTARTGCDALFFNVPELRPGCFGRTVFSREAAENCHLSDGELEMLEVYLEEIVELDHRRGKLPQGEDFFSECVDYFKRLRHSEDRRNLEKKGIYYDKEDAEHRDRICGIPFSSLIIDENSRLLPCFYLPFSIPFAGETDNIVNHHDLSQVRWEILNNRAFREMHCHNCLQFQA